MQCILSRGLIYGLAVYRLNTYPLIHLGFMHAFLNTVALVPLLERFEAEHGTILSAAMFFGRTYLDLPKRKGEKTG